jgi:hypothetical protein
VVGPQHAWWAPNITDPELLHIHRAYARQTGSSRGGDAAASYQIPVSAMTPFRWDVKYDRNGFRNDVDLKSADLIAIGDSFVEGLTVTSPELMTSRLAQLQGKVVANLGQSAYGPLEELTVLRRYGLPLQPRTVIWMFFEGNDLGDVIHYRRTMQNPPTFLRSFWARCFTRSALKEMRRRLSPATRKPSGVTRSGVFQATDGSKVAMYFMYATPPLTQENLNALNETAVTIATAHRLMAAHQSHLIFVFIPAKFRVFHSFCQFPPESECRNWITNDLPERFRTAVGSISSDIGYLDLTPAFVDAVKSGTLSYYADDEHWSPAGHNIAAESIHDYLSTRDASKSKVTSNSSIE